MEQEDNVVDFADYAAEYAASTAYDPDHTPERAQRAFELSNAFGVPASAVYGDVEAYDARQKATLTSELVKRNPQLAEYVEQDPMHARLSQDDWANLDAIDPAMKALSKSTMLKTFASSILLIGQGGLLGLGIAENAGRIGSAALEGYNWAGQQEEFQKLLAEPWARNFFLGESAGPLAAVTPGKAALAGVFAFDSFMRVFNAVMYALSETAAVAAETYGEDPAWARRLARDTYATLQIASTPGIFQGHPSLAANRIKMPKEATDVIRAASPWLMEGKEPPVGLHPEIDRVISEQSQQHLKNFDEVLREAQKSQTRERSPEVFQKFMQLYPDAKVGINIEAFDRLYGDKLPSPEDGKLGWAPNLQAQIESARLTGGDVQIPLADYLSRIDPELAKELHDDIRVKPGDLTKADIERVKEAEPSTPRPVGPVESIRQAAALEPLFALGDRKLELKQKGILPDEGFGAGHTFEMLNEKGQPVGALAVSIQDGGKTVYIDHILGTRGHDANSFGPSLIRDMLRQLKEQFPEAEQVGGFRISGAREKAGSVKTKGETFIRLGIDSPEMLEQFKQILSDRWEPISPDFEVLPLHEKLSRFDTEVEQAINEVLDRVVPQKREVQVVESVRRTEGSKNKIAGVYQPYKNYWPVIAVALDTADPIGYARHEAIHHLRQYGFFTDKEWGILERAAREGKWVDEFEIGKKYKGEPFNVMFEESIAEAYRKWADGKDTPPQLHPIFEKMKQLYEAIKEKLKEVFGKEPTWQEIFQQVEEGKIGRREGTGPRGKEVFRGSEARTEPPVPADHVRFYHGYDEGTLGKEGSRWVTPNKEYARNFRAENGNKRIAYADLKKGSPEEIALRSWDEIDEQSKTNMVGRYKNGEVPAALLQSLEEPKPLANEGKGGQLEMAEATRMEDRSPFAPAPPGMSKDRYNRYMKAIQERQKEDFTKDFERAQAREKRRQSAEWKAEANAMRPEVAEEILNRPDIAADRYFRDGILYGEKVEKIKIGSEYLTTEQRESLPRDYVNKKGMNPDDVAGLFGFESGDAMVTRMGQLYVEWKSTGMRREDFTRQMINHEVERRMEMKHGKLEENILEAAKEQALSENQLSILHEQTLHLAEQAGLQYPLDKKALQAKAMEHFTNLPAESISSDRFLAEAGRAGRAAEMSLLKKDFQEAFKQAQRQEFATIYAKEAIKFEKEQKRFDKLAGRYESRELPKNVERNAALHSIQLLQQAGYKSRLMPEEIRRELAADAYPTLEKYVERAKGDGYDLDEVITPDIIDNGVKAKDQMSTQEWRDFRDAVAGLDHVGRDIEKIEIAGNKVSRAEFRDMVRENLEKRGLIDPNTRNAMAKIWWNMDSRLISMENLIKDFDYRAEMGPMWDAIIRQQEMSKAKAMQLETELGRSFKELPGATYEWRKSLNKEIENPFIKDPMAPGQSIPLTRENMLRIMLNLGTDGNRFKLAQGITMAREGIEAGKDKARIEQTAQLIEQWVNQHASKQDWNFVTHIWKQHEKLRPEVERVQRNTSNVVPKWVEGRKITTPHGEIEGGYYPLAPDRGYQLPGREINFESENLSGGKGPFKQTYVRAKTPQNYLKERTSRPYFVDISSPIENVAVELKQVINDVAYRDFGINAGKIIYDPQIQNMIKRRYGEEYQKRMVPWLEAALNIESQSGNDMGPVSKALRWARTNLVHSALGHNIATIMSPSTGTLNPRAYASYMSSYRANKALVMEHSKELQNIENLMDRDVNTALKRYVKRTLATDVYDDAVKASFEAMKKVQMGLARVTFYEKFLEGKAKGLSDADAAALADNRVRERHGSTGRADMGELMRHPNEFVKAATVFMGYFGTMYNYRRTLAHNAREMFGADSPEAKQLAAKEFKATVVNGVLVPLLFTGLLYTRSKKEEGWMHWLWRVGSSELLGMIPLARELTYFMESGRFGSSPMASTIDALAKFGKDGYNLYLGKPAKKPFQNTMTALGAVGIVPGGMAIGRQFGGLHNVYRGTEPPPRDIGEYWRLIRWGESRIPNK